MDRCVNKDLFNQTVSLINNFKEYFISHGEPIGENPSPGNKKGGITTLEDKSLGCTQKGGTSNVQGVLLYGEKVKNSGLNLLQGPGNDIVAITGLMASGCHIILFSTGRGTPVGSPVPTVKIATNTDLSKIKNLTVIAKNFSATFWTLHPAEKKQETK
jgi:altronate hydrolase